MTPQQELLKLRAQQESLHKTLNKLFGWKDESWLHALLHIENAVKNLQTDLKVERKLREIAEAREEAAEHLSRDLMQASGTIGTLAARCAGLEEDNQQLRDLLYEYAAAKPVKDPELRARVQKALGISRGT